jgi:hypothetical protein
MALASFVDQCEPWQRPYGLGQVTLKEMLAYPRYKSKTEAELAAELQKRNPKLLELGRQLINNIRLYGCPTWYEWRNRNWGTKWNTYDHEEVRETSRSISYVFQTAWGEPQPVFEALKAKFPGLKFSVHVDGEVDRPYSYTL